MGYDDHGGHHGGGEERPADIARNARSGMILFVVYLVFYTAFVLTSAFAPGRMAVLSGGLNLAIWWGFALLGGALVLALAYSWLCRARDVP